MSNLMSSYKLKSEIVNFILEQKTADPILSCRKLVILIAEKFKITLSKSLINSVIKEANLSSKVGRRREKEKTPEFIENGGFIFLKAADIKLSLTTQLTDIFSVYFPDKRLSLQHKINEILIYLEFFKSQQFTAGRQNYRKLGLWWLPDGMMSKNNLSDVSQRLSQISMPEARVLLNKIGIDYNINVFNELHKECLYRLNAYVQTHFFPPGYQFLDSFAMKERFYRLQANIEKKPQLLKIHLFYPTGFFWVNNVMWQEGFSYAANKVNEAGIFNENGDQIWINPCPCFPYENVSNFR